MANRKVTVLNPAGYQELLQSGDNLLIDGSVNLQSNGLTGVPTPTLNVDAANRDYVDTGDILNATEIQNNADDITALDARLTAQEGLPGASNKTVTFTGSVGITFPGNNSFTLNQSSDTTIDIQGPRPGTDGSFVITESSGTVSYSDTVDGGTY